MIRDGGFRRTYALVQRFAELTSTVLIDRRPTPLATGPGLRVVEYSVPGWLTGLQARAHRLGGALEAAVVMAQLVRLGWRETRRRPDAVLYIGSSELPWLTIPAYLVSRMPRRRLHLTNLNTRGVPVGTVVQRLNWRVHASADSVIALSEATRAELRAAGLSRPITVNGCGFDGPPNPSGLADLALRWDAIFIGRLQPEKGIADLLEVWSRVVAVRPSADLLLIGFATSPHRKEILRQVQHLGLSDRVRLAGTLPEAAKWQELARSRLCLFLSHVEGWGLVPLEALSLGVPVVVYDLPCYRESLNGLAGVHRVPLGDIPAAVGKAMELLSLDDVKAREVRAAIRTAFHYPTWQQVADQELALVTSRA